MQVLRFRIGIDTFFDTIMPKTTYANGCHQAWKNYLTLAYWRHVASEIMVNTGSVNDLLPDGNTALPENELTFH